MRFHRQAAAMSFVPPDRSSILRRCLAGILALAVVGCVLTIARRSFEPGAPQLWRMAQAESDQKQWSRALDFAERAMSITPPSNQELALGGIAALHSGRLTRAEELFSRIDDRQPRASAACRRIGSAWLAIGLVTPAERAFRRAIRCDSTNRQARRELAELLRLSGRYFEIEPLIRELIEANDCPSTLLFALAWPDKNWLDDDDRTVIENCLQTDPQAQWIGLALAGVEALTDERRRIAIRRMQEAASDDPGSAEALARWGTLLVESGAWNEVSAWNRLLTEQALTHPQVWYARGLWQLHRDHPSAAIRCFWEALERGPFHAGATYQLSQLLPRSEERDRAGPYLEQARKLAELRLQVVFGEGAGGFPGPDVLRQIVSTLSDLGREWEALGWCQLVTARHPELQWPIAMIENLRPRLSPVAPWIGDEFRISRQVRLDHFPMPDFGSTGVMPPDRTPENASHGIQFEEVSHQRGLAFQYSNGASITEPHGFMYEISGGGAGILDYDLDGWPDFYLTEGGPELSLPRDPRMIDRLFRNRFGDLVLDVTAFAGVVGVGYGQGVSVGDINSDGFPDVFVANIGPNQLWINQGDGTFSDATVATGLEGSAWTMSAVLADVDGDGLTDIFEVGYLGGDALSRTCRRDASVVQCRPSMFPGEPDRMWLNRGDGRMADVSQSAGVHQPAGRGLGVVAADFEGQGRLTLFVANDLEPNTCFRNEASTRGDPPRFIDEAIPRGLAFNAEGRPLSSMGIAIDDIDRDGRLDLYVTNFLAEASNLYVQDADGAFSDRSSGFGIYDASFAVMGWGAQFLDADLDGWPDLIVANGHLEDYHRWNIASQMPTQVLRNRNGQRFDLLAPDELSPWFLERHFGRTVAKFDGNRDGREDFLVTHVDAPVAWLQNASRNAGHSLAVRLVGTTSERDAIGARLTVSAAGQILRKQLTAGDGFQASNQRQIVFGLGNASRVDELQVDWPSGLTQRFSELPADCEVLLREGCTRWYNLRTQSAEQRAEE